jgi:molybdenum cofactor synthesis domain-containing protein
LRRLLEPAHRFLYSPAMASAVILTIGNELVSGDIPNTNGSWLAKRLEPLGVRVRLLAAVPDEIEMIAEFIRDRAPRCDLVLVTGGLGGTPDDVTREAVAAAFGVGQEEVPELAERLRARFQRDPEYAARWARLPTGARPLENPLGGAPGFVIGNVYVLPGLPAEMEAMFATVEEELRRPAPIRSWRRRYRTRESTIVGVLQAMGERHPGVLVGSYPTFGDGGPEVEVVVKSSDPEAFAAASAWIEAALEEATR